MGKSFWLFKDKKPVFLKIFISYIFVFTIPLVGIGIVTYYWTINIFKQQVEQTYTSTLEDIKNTMDRNFNSLGLFAAQLSQIPWVKKIMYMRESLTCSDRIDPIAFVEYIQELSAYTAVNRFIDDIAIYFNDKDKIISTRGIDTPISFFENTFNFDGLTYEQWINRLSHYDSSSILPPLSVKTYGQCRRLLTYVQSLPPNDTNFKAYLMVFIEENALRSIFENTIIANNGSLYIMDSANNFITGINTNDNILSYIKEQKYSNDRKHGALYSDFIPVGNDRDAVFYSISAINGWKYIAAVPMNTILSKANYVRMLTVYVALLSTLIGPILSYWLTMKSYKPLANVISIIRSRLFPGEQSISNEYSLLERAICEILDCDNKVQHQIAQYKPLAQNAYLLKLLKGELRNNMDVIKILDTLSIAFTNSYFTCISILLNENTVLNHEMRDYIETKLSCYNSPIYFVEADVKNKIIILNTIYEQQAKQITNIIKDCLCDISLGYKAIGIGKTYKGINGLPNSCNEATAATDYRFVKGSGCIVFFDEIEQDKTDFYYYPTDKEEHIINYIKSGDYALAIDLCKDIINRNIHERCLSPNTMKHLFYSLSVSGLKALEDINIGNNIPIYIDDVLYMDTIDEANMYVEELYHHICDIIIKEKESHNAQLRQDIIEYIDNNFTDNNICLTNIANKFSVSPAYLSRFIKDQTGCNFIDYLNKRRIEASKTLLAGNHTILEIARLVGFDNDVTFRRLFKKYEGVTPGQYRDNILKLYPKDGF